METTKRVYVVQGIMYENDKFEKAFVLHVYDSLKKASDYIDEIEKATKNAEGYTFTRLGGNKYVVERNGNNLLGLPEHVKRVYSVKAMDIE